MVEQLPDHVIAELARRQATQRAAQEETAVREALIAHVEQKMCEKTSVDNPRRLAEIAVDALADFVDRGGEFIEPWHGRATTHG